jgi:hypothetical protein
MELESPKEEERRQLKMDKSKEIGDAITYLKTTFWQYATNEYRYNYTKEEFRVAVGEDLSTLKKFVIDYADQGGRDSTNLKHNYHLRI